ncbi:hypothetical protein DUNSADRAFT_4169 [Dunaliella salina]|uniref:Uncharacterized protein n=1 Tax=Dunaliella salina TaxID=3046 RepID=A0ABQ7GSR2_DUNSA|nr:hypothetical protein DUNSADRAFT_4169 [Dunaliella salina]|eukprot:KAF5837598.1 hypothetical protein DUNSADRAFT_4169 [Dunaliella salina]
MLRNRHVGRNVVAGGSVSDIKARLPQQLRAHTRFPLLPPVKAFSPQQLGATAPNNAKLPLSSPSNRDATLQPFSPLSLSVSSGNGTTAAPTTSHVSFDPIQRSETRRAKLSQLLEIRAIYRNYIRAKTLLSMPFPVYSPSVPPEAGKEATASGASGGESEGVDPQRLSFEQLEEFQEQERRKEAVDAVAEMLLAAEQIKVGLRTLPQGFGQVLVAPGSPETAVEEAEALVRNRGKEFVQQLQKRVSEEMPLLPFGSEMAAQAALETQKARSVRSAQQRGDFEAMQLAINEGGSSAAGDAHEGSEGEGGGSNSSSSSSSSSSGLVLPGQDAALQLERGIEQLAQAEKVAGKFVATRIKPVLRKAQNAEVGDIVRGTGSYLKGLWQRLNGGGDRAQEPALSPDLPLPKSGSAKDTELIISQLSLELDDLAKRLREAGRTRENKLKQAKAPEGRVTMPFLLKSMDEEVLRLSRELALRTLQLEMEYAYRALEDEAIDIVGYDVNGECGKEVCPGVS